MRSRSFAALAVAFAAFAMQAALPSASFAADAAAPAPAPGATTPKPGWYPELADFAFVRQQVDIPPRKGVMLIDSRPAARQYDPGHIPGAVNIPDSKFEQLAATLLPADKQTLLLFYCGGVDCMLSHNSAFKAKALGYEHIRVYADGMPDWKRRGETVAVSAAHLRKLIDEKAAVTLIDARPRRVADKGMIPTAINIPDSEFDKHVDKLPADKATPLVFYCGGLDCVLSDKSAAKARQLGYTSVMTYPPGYPEWQSLYGGAAAAAEASPAALKATALVPQPAAVLQPGKEKGSVTVASFVKAWQEAPASLLLVDVRDAKEFAAGTIPGAISLPIGELEKRVATLPTGKPVVFICGTGARAGEAYDTVKLLRDEVQAYFLDANIKFGADGAYSVAEK